jgi:hypothetical protein
LGGNASTLAFVSSLHTESPNVTVFLVPVAHTPAGAVCGDLRQTISVPFEGLLDWIDATFSPDDERAFLAPAHDIELLARIDWHVEPPVRLDDSAVLNLEDVPEEISLALAQPPARLVQCASCRRLCVWGEFVWKERQLCAWDFHRQVFGKRGPWHSGEYRSQDLSAAPSAAYIADPLLCEAGAEIVLAISAAIDGAALELVNAVIRELPNHAYMVVRTPSGMTVLRERE